MQRRRRRGTGSAPRWLEASHRWQGRYTGLDGKQHSVYGPTEAVCEKKLDTAMRRDLPQLRVRIANAKGNTSRTRRYVIGILVAEARAQGWDDTMLVTVLTAQMSATRMSKGIVGPCYYCGTWEASEVEHMIPRTRGGTDHPNNLVSSCFACNHEKNDLTAREYEAVRYLEVHGELPAGFVPDDPEPLT